MKHTKEPWKIRRFGEKIIISTPTIDKHFMCIGQIHMNRSEDAQRIVDCVNACAGQDLNVVREAGKMLEELMRLCNLCRIDESTDILVDCPVCKTRAIINRTGRE
jgi:hypothetical protein